MRPSNRPRATVVCLFYLIFFIKNVGTICASGTNSDAQVFPQGGNSKTSLGFSGGLFVRILHCTVCPCWQCACLVFCLFSPNRCSVSTCSARDWDGKDYLRIIPRVVLVEDPRLTKGHYRCTANLCYRWNSRYDTSQSVGWTQPFISHGQQSWV